MMIPGRFREAIRRAENEFVGDVGHATIIFGSLARGAGTDANDLDVIFIVSRDADRRRGYWRRRYEGINADVNVLDIPELTQNLFDPDWQYRIVHSLSIQKDWSKESNRVMRWLFRTRELIESEESRRARIEYLTGDIEEIVRVYRHLSEEDWGLRSYLVAEITQLWLKKIVEEADELPFSRRDLWKHGVIAADSQQSTALKMHPLLGRQLRRAPIDVGWSDLKAFLSACRSVYESGDRRLRGEHQKIVLKQDLDNLVSLEPELRDIVEKHSWTSKDNRSFIEEIVPLGERAEGKEGRTLGQIAVEGRSVDTTKDEPRHFRLDRKRARAKIIIALGGCEVETCTFCALPDLARVESVEAQVDRLAALPDWVRRLAIYCDGSFFDDREISPSTRRRIAETVSTTSVQMITVESLPQFVTRKKVRGFWNTVGDDKKLVIGVGLQSMNQSVRKYSLGTPISDSGLEEFWEERSALEFGVRIYLLYGKPLLTEQEDRCDVEQSIRKLRALLGPDDRVTINKCLPTSGTVTDKLAKIGLYRYPSDCEFRRSVRGAIEKGGSLSIEVGPLDVGEATCSEWESADRTSCAPCRRVLEQYVREGVSPNPLEAECRSSFGDERLAWTCLGRLSNRSAFVLNRLE